MAKFQFFDNIYQKTVLIVDFSLNHRFYHIINAQKHVFLSNFDDLDAAITTNKGMGGHCEIYLITKKVCLDLKM